MAGGEAAFGRGAREQPAGGRLPLRDLRRVEHGHRDRQPRRHDPVFSQLRPARETLKAPRDRFDPVGGLQVQHWSPWLLVTDNPANVLKFFFSSEFLEILSFFSVTFVQIMKEGMICSWSKCKHLCCCPIFFFAEWLLKCKKNVTVQLLPLSEVLPSSKYSVIIR